MAIGKSATLLTVSTEPSRLPQPDWPAPAKLNLFLHVTGRRGDGYHELQTAFQFLDFGDRLGFRVRPDGRLVRRRGPPGVSMERDLVVRAARELQRISGTGLGAELYLDKRLPVGAGLGGGSSDAATTLVALNHLWDTGLSREQLAAIALRLGADVPVFVHGHAAWAEGIGERLQPLTPEERWYALLLPPCEVSTAAAFAAPELTRHTPPITIPAFLAGAGRNDFAPVVCAQYPDVAEAMAWLQGYGKPCLTGTGAAVFMPCSDQQGAREVVAALPEQMQARGFVARAVQGLNESPLYQRLTE